MTIIVTDDYVLGASKVLEFHDENAFELQAGTPSLEIRGAVALLGEQDFEPLHAIAGGAAAAQVTITATGSVILQQTGISSSPVAGEFGAGSTVTNRGLVEVQSASLSGVGFIFHDGGSQFTNTGVLSVSATGGGAVGVSGEEAQTINDGLIQVVGREQTVGVQGALDNSGTIRAIATNDVTAVDATGDFDNTGRILTHCSVGGAVGVKIEQPFGFGFSNGGQIIASGAFSTGIEIETTNINPGFVTRMATQTLDNSGLIKAHTAIQAMGGAMAASVSLHNSGDIRGDILLGDQSDSIANAGKIAGNVLMGDGADSFSSVGGVAKGVVAGGLGDDVLTGGKYADHLFGDDPSPNASDGADTLTGGKGADTLTGGGGADHFVYQTVNDSTASHADLITDLQDGDTIDLTAIDADRTIAGDQAFFFVSAFDGRAGEATLTYDAGQGVTRLELDVNGDQHADSVILIAGDHSGFTGFAT